MLNDLFPLNNYWVLIIAFVFSITSIWALYKKKYSYAICFLFVSALAVRLFMAWLDPFLHTWDECFHALVSRNMMDHPFKPMLVANPVTDYTIDNWCNNHIWLHKQPLFLWQMALSMKVFGVSPFAIRYPAVLMGALMVPILYRIVFIATANTKVAFMSAMLMCFSYYHLELLAGYYGMDQNDIAFNFYVLASIWAYMEYTRKKSIGWAVLIGLLSGCAVLNKWLTGLLAFGGWGLNILLAIKQRESRREIVHLLISLTVCIAVFLPWQLYIFHAFPAEAKYEFEFNSRHIWEVWFYYDFFSTYFGRYIWILVFVGLFLLPFIRAYRNKRILALTIFFIVAYSFFSFIAKTKIYSYFMIVVPIGYMYISIATYQIIEKARVLKYAYIPLAIVSALVLFDLPDITAEHDKKNTELNNVASQTYNARIYRDIKEYIPSDATVVMNLASLGDAETVMFFNKDITAYDYVPAVYQIDEIKQKGLRIAVFPPKDGKALPDYLQGYPNLYIINKQLK